MSQNQKKQQGFASKLGFILATAGSAIGLGNLWRFPWQVSKYGGGAFVLVYVIMAIILGLPIMIAEIFIGRRAKSTVVDSYGKINKNLKWVGFLAVLVSFFITSYYTIIGGWSLKYSLNYIFTPGYLTDAAGATIPASDYFTNFIASPYLAPFFGVLFLGLTVVVVAQGIEEGIEKASKVLLPLLLLIVLTLAIFAVSHTNRDGVKKGLTFYMGEFDFKKLGWDGTIGALSQAFFSLSLGMGIMIAYGSYTGEKMNLAKSAATVIALDTIFALVAGFIIFPSIHTTLAKIDPDTLKGPGLLFVVMPKVIEALPAGQLFGFLFFILVGFAAITSLFSLFEVVTQYTIVKFNMTRKKAAYTFGALLGILSILISLSQGGKYYQMFGFDLLTYFDEITNTVLLPFLGLMSVIALTWLIKKDQLFDELKETQSEFKIQKIWYYLTKFFVPIPLVILLVMGVYGNFKGYKEEGKNYGYILVGVSVFVVISIIANILWNNEKYMSKRHAKTESPLEKSIQKIEEEKQEEELLETVSEIE